MRTLIVLCAGDNMLKNKPAILEKHPLNGVALAYKAIEGIYPESYNRIIFTILEEMDIKYKLSSELDALLSSQLNIEMCLLPKKTSGPAESAFLTINQMSVVGEVTIRDSHNYIRLEKPSKGNCIAGVDLTKIEGPIENLRSKSFLVLNEQNQVLDIIEKSFRSDVISVGLYSFRDAKDFIDAYNRLNNTLYPIGKLYISHIISYLIGYYNRMFYVLPAYQFEDWGSLTAWHNLQKQYATYFLDLDDVKRYMDTYHIKAIKELEHRRKRGAKIIGCIQNPESDIMEVQKEFEAFGILVDGVIKGINASSERIFLSDLGDL